MEEANGRWALRWGCAATTESGCWQSGGAVETRCLLYVRCVQVEEKRRASAAVLLREGDGGRWRAAVVAEGGGGRGGDEALGGAVVVGEGGGDEGDGEEEVVVVLLQQEEVVMEVWKWRGVKKMMGRVRAICSLGVMGDG